MPYHQTPNPVRKKLGRPCRLFGEDFISISQASRHYDLSYKRVYLLVSNNLYREGSISDLKRTAV